MTVLESSGDGAFPPAVADAVEAAVEKTFAAICGEKPIQQPSGQQTGSCACVIGIISFVGETPWSLSLALADDTAPALVHKFVGFEIAFDSPDMGDAVGELVNVLAGDVVAQLEQRRIKAQMTLPTVARGSAIQLFPESGTAAVQLDYASKQGSFWVRLMSAKPGQIRDRLSGR